MLGGEPLLTELKPRARPSCCALRLRLSRRFSTYITEMDPSGAVDCQSTFAIRPEGVAAFLKSTKPQAKLIYVDAVDRQRQIGHAALGKVAQLVEHRLQQFRVVGYQYK
jgi:hypothetical protein